MKTSEASYFRALYDVVVAVNSSLDPQEVLTSIVEGTASAMDAKGCSIMLLTPDRRELRHSIACGLSEWYVRKGPVKVDLSMSETLKGQSVAVTDAGSDPRVQYGPENVQEGIASILSVPIRLRDEVIGVMRVYSGTPRQFSPDDVEFVGAVAHLGAIALQNAYAHEELKSSYDMVTRYVYNDSWVGSTPQG